MRLLAAAVNALSVLVAGICVGTTVVQAVGIGWLLSTDKLSSGKAVRYAAVIYGIDLAEIPTDPNSSSDQPLDELRSHDDLLDSRVNQTQLLQQRINAVERTTDDIRLVFAELRSENERYEEIKERFDGHLAQLEADARTEAIQEVERTLEVLQPKQSKALILRMLEDHELDTGDDVLGDVVTIIKTMPEDKRKKILGEFKTEDERESFHDILIEIGELDTTGAANQ